MTTSEVDSRPPAIEDAGQASAASLPAVWAEFATRLASVLARMREDQCLIVADKRCSRFVQLTDHGVFGLHAELPPNSQLLPSDQLDASQRSALAMLGWQNLSPDDTTDTQTASACKEPDRPFLDCPAGSNLDALAEGIAHALRDALEVLSAPPEYWL